MIALVADPVNSHLALTFDRTVESLMRGASTAGYSYVNYYFPWETALAKNQSDVEKRKQQRDEKRRVEKWPGLLLFRAKDGEDIVESGDRCGCRYQQLPLAIFLVAETPTAGINRFEFQRAGSYITEGNRWPCPVPIVGPTFSGSAQSLVQAIETRGSQRFRIYNGSATSKDARTNIAEALPELDGAAGFA